MKIWSFRIPGVKQFFWQQPLFCYLPALQHPRQRTQQTTTAVVRHPRTRAGVASRIALFFSPEEPILRGGYSPDGEAVASGSFPEDRPWEATTGELLYNREHKNAVDDVHFSPGGEIVGAGQSAGGAVLSCMKDGELLHKLHGYFNSRLAFSPFYLR